MADIAEVQPREAEQSPSQPERQPGGEPGGNAPQQNTQAQHQQPKREEKKPKKSSKKITPASQGIMAGISSFWRNTCESAFGHTIAHATRFTRSGVVTLGIIMNKE